MPKETKWPALLRGSIMSATIAKHVNYVGLADRRAQTIITINSFLIPVALAFIDQPQFRAGITIGVITGMISIAFAIIALLPKHYATKHDNELHLLHFSGIREHHEAEYVEKLSALFEDTHEMGKAVASDLYHVSTFILKPKFKWIRLAYFTFINGYAIALVVILLSLP